jgi:hypothetical protein
VYNNKWDIAVAKQTLPCAGKNCKSKMTLTDNTDNLLYYNCITNHDEHTFRYNMEQKKWEKIIIKTKIILHYNENPCNQPHTSVTDHIVEINQKPGNDLAKISNTDKTKKGSKKAKKPEHAGIKELSDPAQTTTAEQTKTHKKEAEKLAKKKREIPVKV